MADTKNTQQARDAQQGNQECLHGAVKCNADAGLVWTPPAGSVLLDTGLAS